MATLPAARLTPNPDNPRFIRDDSYQKLLQSIQDFPEMAAIREIVVNKEYVILGGNMRYRAMLEAGWKDIPVKVVDWSPDKQKEFVIKDNVSGGDWDWDILADQWDSDLLEEWGLDLPATFGDDETEEDEAPEVSSEPAVSQLGEVYQLGRHRLMCGDSTDGESVNTLLNGVTPTLMVTDPPYGVNYEADWRVGYDLNMGKKIGLPHQGRAVGKVINDDRADWTEAFELFKGNIAYVFHGGLHSSEVANSLTATGFDLVAQIIWVKQHFVFSRGDYHWQHEPIWYAVRKGAKHGYVGDRKQTTVWNIENNNPIGHSQGKEDKVGHSTQKPVAVMAKPIENNTSAGQVVYDPFLGSGTTIISAEQLGRTCYGLELSPAYCDVIRKRYAKYIEEDDWEAVTPQIV